MKERRPISEEAMRLRLADLCARTEQCAYDLRQKMRRASLTEEQASRILEALTREKFLDEHRYARAFARDKVKFAGWGTMKIRQALAAKRLDRSAIDDGIAAIDRREYIDALKRVAIAKARTLDLTTPEGGQKLYRHLASRGFESSLISKIVDFLRRG